MSFRTRYGMSLACVLVAFAVLALACASSTKLAPVMPGTFPLGLPGVPAGFADKIYCATPSVSSTCANSRSGELTCQDILREEAANLLYESQEEDVTRVKNRLRAIVNLEDDREYLDEMTIGTKFKSTSRRLESNVFKTNDGSTRSMRVCVSNEQFRFDLLLKMEELATQTAVRQWPARFVTR